MTSIQFGPLPPSSLIYEFATVQGGYCDCYYADTKGDADLQSYIDVFFGTWVFRLELKILSMFGLNRDSPDQVKLLAEDRVRTLAAWKVEDRTETDLLLAVGTGPIRTWLRIEAGPENAVRLYFGSALLPMGVDRHGRPRLDVTSVILLPFHRLYSRILLRAALKKWNIRSALK